MKNKAELDNKIKNKNIDFAKSNSNVQSFYDQVCNYHNMVDAKKEQEIVIQAQNIQKQEAIKHTKQQGELLKDIISQYEKDKAVSDAKNKEIINYKNCNVIIRQGDLTDEREDAIVNPTTEDLAYKGWIAKAITEKGGHVVQQESEEYIMKHGIIPIGEATTINAGDLLCEKLIHVVGPIYPQNNMRDQKQRKELGIVIKSILREMKEQNMNSVSFPAISAGIFRFPLELCATIIGNMLKEAIDNDPEFYKDKTLIICNPDDKTTKNMLEYIPGCFIEEEISDTYSENDFSDASQTDQEEESKYDKPDNSRK